MQSEKLFFHVEHVGSLLRWPNSIRRGRMHVRGKSRFQLFVRSNTNASGKRSLCRKQSASRL